MLVGAPSGFTWVKEDETLCFGSTGLEQYHHRGHGKDLCSLFFYLSKRDIDWIILVDAPSGFTWAKEDESHCFGSTGLEQNHQQGNGKDLCCLF